jgi:AraC-like DNA-binding protein
VEFLHLSEKIRALIAHSPTLFAALRQVCRWAPLEDTNLMMWLEHDDDCTRICSKLDGTTGLLHLEHSQWLQNIFPIHIVRQFAGPDWNPATIAFEARYAPSLETQALWPNTRFLSGQSASWIDVPASFLSLPNLSRELPPNLSEEESSPPDVDLIATLKLMLPSYLGQNLPTVAEAAEIAGISLRSFQRRLLSMGLSYSALVDIVRFETAASLLRETDTKIIDIALATGYADSAHFTRAFRRLSGVPPRGFREQWRPR